MKKPLKLNDKAEKKQIIHRYNELQYIILKDKIIQKLYEKQSINVSDIETYNNLIKEKE